MKRQVEEMKAKGLGRLLLCRGKGLQCRTCPSSGSSCALTVGLTKKDDGLEVWLYDEYPNPAA